MQVQTSPEEWTALFSQGLCSSPDQLSTLLNLHLFVHALCEEGLKTGRCVQTWSHEYRVKGDVPIPSWTGHVPTPGSCHFTPGSQGSRAPAQVGISLGFSKGSNNLLQTYVFEEICNHMKIRVGSRRKCYLPTTEGITEINMFCATF